MHRVPCIQSPELARTTRNSQSARQDWEGLVLVRSTKTGVETRLAASPAITATLASFGAALAGRKFGPTIATYHKVVSAFATYSGKTRRSPTSQLIHRALSDRARASCGGDDRERPVRYPRVLPLGIKARLRAGRSDAGASLAERFELIPRALKLRELRLLDQILDTPLPVLDVKTRHVRARHNRAILLMWYAGLRISEVPAAGLARR